MNEEPRSDGKRHEPAQRAAQRDDREPHRRLARPRIEPHGHVQHLVAQKRETRDPATTAIGVRTEAISSWKNWAATCFWRS